MGSLSPVSNFRISQSRFDSFYTCRRMDGNRLAGSLPSELAALTSLRYMYEEAKAACTSTCAICVAQWSMLWKFFCTCLGALDLFLKVSASAVSSRACLPVRCASIQTISVYSIIRWLVPKSSSWRWSHACSQVPEQQPTHRLHSERDVCSG